MSNIMNNKWGDLKVGDKVHYIPFEGCDDTLIQNGKVKSLSDMVYNIVFVVFNCNNEWDNYMDYTGQGTSVKQLKKGWYE